MCAKNLIFLLTVIITNFKYLTPARAIAFDEVSSLHIWITVSSLANRDPVNSKQLLFRNIELNWINAPLDDQNDYIGLYLDQQPDQMEAHPVSVHKLNGRMHGKLTTGHYLPLINFMNETRTGSHSHWSDDGEISYDVEPSVYPAASSRNGDFADNWHLRNTYRARSGRDQRHRTQESSSRRPMLGEECVGYCVAYHSQSRILASNCLKTSPNWMKDSQSTSRSLPSLMIPGTHNSATYPRLLDKSALQIINKYQINQEEPIFNQLVYGIRYLDLRVGHSKVKQRPEELWIYHDIFRTDVSVNEVFEQVARFLELTTHEVIVMDFHRFTVGFQNENLQTQRERHAHLLELLFRKLGQYIIPSYLGQHAPLNEYISMGKRLVVGYASRSQLLGALADNHASMIGLHLAQASNRNQQVRDIDADEQNIEPNSADFGQAAELQPDSRVGTRIYNKLKSLKLISRQFSRRSIEEGGQLLSSQYQHLTPMSASLKSKPHSERVATSETVRMSAKLVLAKESVHSLEEAVSSLPSRLAILFPPVRHLWPNKDTMEGLAQYMNDTTCRKYFGELHSMMVELTPTLFGAISDKYDGNRRLADLANRPVTDWVRQRWLHCINIVASDFFLGNDLISLSIYANRMRLSNNNRNGHPNDLTVYGGQCKSFRRIGQLLDNSRIAAASSQSQPASMNTQQSANPDGISELYSFFKRIFNL